MRERYLGLGLHGEGPTDQRFLSPVLARLTSNILAQHGRYPVLVGPVADLTSVPAGDRADGLSRAVEKAQGAVDLLFVHADGAGDPTGARATIVQPLIDRMVADHGDDAPVCVPVIPVREMEAWVIADPAAIAGLLRSKLDAAALGLPDDPAECESVPDPKAALEQAMALARSKTRRRRGSITYEPLGERVDLSRLMQLDAFRTLHDDLVHELSALRILTPEAP